MAAGLLGIKPEQNYHTNYIGNVIPWRRETVLALQRRIAEVSGKPWQVALTRRLVFAEYILYGMFSHDVKEQSASQWDDGVVRTLCYWGTKPLELAELEDSKPSSYRIITQ